MWLLMIQHMSRLILSLAPIAEADFKHVTARAPLPPHFINEL